MFPIGSKLHNNQRSKRPSDNVQKLLFEICYIFLVGLIFFSIWFRILLLFSSFVYDFYCFSLFSGFLVCLR
jgi:hypothetical protein